VVEAGKSFSLLTEQKNKLIDSFCGIATIMELKDRTLKQHLTGSKNPGKIKLRRIILPKSFRFIHPFRK